MSLVVNTVPRQGKKGSGVHFMSFHLSSIKFALAISIMSEWRERVAKGRQVVMQKSVESWNSDIVCNS